MLHINLWHKKLLFTGSIVLTIKNKLYLIIQGFLNIFYIFPPHILLPVLEQKSNSVEPTLFEASIYGCHLAVVFLRAELCFASSSSVIFFCLF